MSTFTTYPDGDVTDRLGELLDEASISPIGITMHERLMAYIVSSSDYEAMLQRIQFLEDQLWLGKADAARAEGHADEKRVNAFLRDFSDGIDNEEAAIDKAGS